MSDKFILGPVPLVDFPGLLKVKYLFDDRQINAQQPNGPIRVPDGLPVFPRIVIQPVANNGDPIGYEWTYDPEADRDRGGWVVYDPDLYLVPKSQALVDAGTKSAQPSTTKEVELSGEVTPDPAPPSSDGDLVEELEEPSLIDDDEDDEDLVTAD